MWIKALDEVRWLMGEMSPPVLHELGLEAAIDWLGDKLLAPHGIEFQWQVRGDLKDLKGDIEILLFRWIEGILTHLVLEAKALRAKVDVVRDQEDLTVIIEYVGARAGCSSRRAASRLSALTDIQDRVKLLGRPDAG